MVDFQTLGDLLINKLPLDIDWYKKTMEYQGKLHSCDILKVALPERAKSSGLRDLILFIQDSQVTFQLITVKFDETCYNLNSIKNTDEIFQMLYGILYPSIHHSYPHLLPS